MFITRLSLQAFRNYKELSLEPGKGLTVFVGPNATGKTNLVEAIDLLSTGRSFRNPKWPELVRWGDQAAQLEMSLENEYGTHNVRLVIDRSGSRSWSRDGIKKYRVSDVVGLLPSVVFTPDDLSLAKGPAERRRTAIDDLGEQLSKTYGSIRRDYARVVRQRNLLLRDVSADSTALCVWNEQFVRLGASLYTHRRRLLTHMAIEAARVYADIAADERLELRYEDKIGGSIVLGEDETHEQAMQLMNDALIAREADETRRQTTLVGPHRDDVVFLINGKDARAFASQGQQRSVALAWKWAEVKAIENIARQRPVLLLDDVMSELDAARREALTTLVVGRVQTFITTTDVSHFDHELLASAYVMNTAEHAL